MSSLQGKKAQQSQPTASPSTGGRAGKVAGKKSDKPPTGGQTGKAARKGERQSAAAYYFWAKGQRRKEGKRQAAKGQKRKEGKHQAAVDFTAEQEREEKTT